MNHKNLIYSVIIFAAVILNTGCGSPLAPFDQRVIMQAKDDSVPVIVITSPSVDSLYSQTVVVEGRVSDDGYIMPSLDYTVADALGSLSKTGNVDITPVETETGMAGTFSFQFTTAEYSTDILLTLNGCDWNDNECPPVTLRLEYPGSAIPSFNAVPGNKMVSLSWEEVEGAESYDVYYTVDGNYPSAQYGMTLTGIQTGYDEDAPLVLNNLENGKVYTFLIKASSGDTAWSSDYIKTVPLSPLSLKPVIRSMPESLQLDWQTMSSGLEYQVFRKTGLSGGYVNISGNISSSSFIDNDVESGIDYFYKIIPAVEGSIFSIASSSSPTVFPYALYRTASTAATEGGSSDVDVEGTMAYLALGTAGLQRVNVFNKSNPISAAAYTWSDCSVKAVDVSGSFAFIADQNRGMQIYSFNKPDFGLKGLCQTSHSSHRINDVAYSDSSGEYVYAAWPLDMGPGSGGVDKISVSNKNSPAVLDTYTRTDADYYKIAVSADGAYAFCVYIDPWTPVFGMDIIRTSDMVRVYPSSGDGLPALDVSLIGDTAYVIDGTWLTAYDVSSPTSPTQLGRCAVPGNAREIDVEGDFAYVTEEDGGLRMINISDPVNPVLIDFYSEESVSGIDVSAGYAYIAASDSVFTILNVAEFFDLNQDVLHPVAGGAHVLEQVGDYILIGNDNSELLVIDISDPSNPVNLCSFSALGDIRGIKASGNYLYLTVSEFGGLKALQVVDFSNPASGWNPDSFSFELNDSVGGLALKGDYAYLSQNDSGFTIVDITEPSDSGWPTFSSTVDTAGRISDCVVNGDSLYLLTSALGLQVFDITRPHDPEFAGIYSTSGDALGLDAQNGWVYIADGFDGFAMIDVSSPVVSGWSPSVYGYDLEDDDFYVCDVKAAGDYAYITYYDRVPPYDKSPGLAVVGISNPASIHIVGTMDIQGTDANNLITNGETVFIAADDDGLEIINMSYKE